MFQALFVFHSVHVLANVKILPGFSCCLTVVLQPGIQVRLPFSWLFIKTIDLTDFLLHEFLVFRVKMITFWLILEVPSAHVEAGQSAKLSLLLFLSIFDWLVLGLIFRYPFPFLGLNRSILLEGFRFRRTTSRSRGFRFSAQDFFERFG
jgi:hypothetical protein